MLCNYGPKFKGLTYIANSDSQETDGQTSETPAVAQTTSKSSNSSENYVCPESTTFSLEELHMQSYPYCSIRHVHRSCNSFLPSTWTDLCFLLLPLFAYRDA